MRVPSHMVDVKKAREVAGALLQRGVGSEQPRPKDLSSAKQELKGQYLVRKGH